MQSLKALNLRNFNIGDKMEVGPTPVNKLFMRGSVAGRDDTMNRLIIRIEEMISLPNYLLSPSLWGFVSAGDLIKSLAHP